ncbi:hypothetical protein BDV3_001981 [Batrachochytrium dendrobatidis]
MAFRCIRQQLYTHQLLPQKSFGASLYSIRPFSQTGDLAVRESRYTGFWDLILETPIAILNRKDYLDSPPSSADFHQSSSTTTDYPLRSQPIDSQPSIQFANINSLSIISLKFQTLTHPNPPSSTDCCMGGCKTCVWDIYATEMDTYRAELNGLQARWIELGGEANALDKMSTSILDVEMDPGMKALRDMERELKLQKRLRDAQSKIDLGVVQIA